MIDIIYLEESVRDHPRSQEILQRFPQASVFECRHYKEVFNPSGQSFRLQKKKPALILARQSGKLLHEIPKTYGVGGVRNFYFSHLLNCPYDCRYCFLQGMYPSAHYLLFVNYEDFQDKIKQIIRQSNEPSWFFSGYDCDSLALEGVSKFAANFLPFFSHLPKAWLELRTKSVATQILSKIEPFANAVVAFSFTPEAVSEKLEHGTPSVQSRIKAMKEVATLGWKIGIRFDPVIECRNFESRYQSLIQSIFNGISEKSIHSVSLGSFRMPVSFFKKIEKHYPEEPLFAGNFQTKGGLVSYREDTIQKRLDFCKDQILQFVESEKYFSSDN